MRQGVDAILDWTETFNSGTVIEGGEIEAYLIQRSMDYPRDPQTGKPSAAVHPQLQDQDYCLLQHGDPVFLTFSGETLSYEEEEPLHPLFINEAAYYEKGIAFHLAHKKRLSIPSLQMSIIIIIIIIIIINIIITIITITIIIIIIIIITIIIIINIITIIIIITIITIITIIITITITIIIITIIIIIITIIIIIIITG
ncbi:hypothetical protein QTP86_029848 [Hemibagrus guttatus]|nr:hypothetical protein QTP86_029848 [Hemibagrus guttatus]